MTTFEKDATEAGKGRLYRSLWRFAGSDRPTILAFMAILLLAQLVRLSIPYFTGAAVNAMQASGAADLRAAGWNMALIFLACVAGWALHGPGRVIERFVAIRIRERFADTLYGTLMRLPLGWHERNHSGDMIQRVEKSGNALFGFAEHQFVYLQNAVSLIGPIVAIFLLSLPTGLTAVAGYAVIGIALLRLDNVMIRLSRAQNAAEARYVAALVDCLGNIATVLTLRLGPATQRHVRDRLTAVFAPLRSGIVVNEAKWCAIDLFNAGLRCGLAVLYAWLAYRSAGSVLLGSVVMVYQYAQQAGGVVSNMAGNYQDLVRYHTDLGSADPILAAREARAAPVSLPADWREIRVEGLGFRHESSGDRLPALRDISLVLARGRRIAIVGESGSGKSTLLRVLAGLYPPQQARYRIDGLARPEVMGLGAIATLVPQDAEIFAGTIRHNIALGEDHHPQELQRAVDLAEFVPVLACLPQGLDTDISERGFNLSGGQKQRLALARAILAARASSLLLLDEPTSSLDPTTEARVYDNLLRAFPQACILSSIHRLHLLDRFDEVAVMHEGRLLAVGAPEELRQGEPQFRALWERYVGGAAAGARPGKSIAA